MFSRKGYGLLFVPPHTTANTSQQLKRKLTGSSSSTGSRSRRCARHVLPEAKDPRPFHAPPGREQHQEVAEGPPGHPSRLGARVHKPKHSVIADLPASSLRLKLHQRQYPHPRRPIIVSPRGPRVLHDDEERGAVGAPGALDGSGPQAGEALHHRGGVCGAPEEDSRVRSGSRPRGNKSEEGLAAEGREGEPVQERALLEVGEGQEQEAEEALGLGDGPVALDRVRPRLASDRRQRGGLVELLEGLTRARGRRDMYMWRVREAGT